MRFLNLVANKDFSLPGYSDNGSPIRCAAPRFCTAPTKSASKVQVISSTSIRSAIDLIFGASRLSLNRHGLLLLRMVQVCVFAYQSALNWMQ